MNTESVVQRFIRYAMIDTQSKADQERVPSTEKQFDLARLLEKELNEMGLKDVRVDEHCYVYATLPSNTDSPARPIGFIAHMDTAPDFSGKDVKPQVIHYEGAERQKLGKGVIVYEGDGSFYLSGVGYKLTLIRKTTPEDMADVLRYQKPLTARNLFYLEASEGSLTEEGVFLPRRRRNGDETDTGLWVATDVGVVHAKVF